MKSITRAFVLALALTGMSAGAYSTVGTPSNLSTVTASKATAFPIPTCPWNDPNECGMAGPNPGVAGKK